MIDILASVISRVVCFLLTFRGWVGSLFQLVRTNRPTYILDNIPEMVVVVFSNCFLPAVNLTPTYHHLIYRCKGHGCGYVPRILWF